MERNISENIDETIAWHRRAAEAGNAKSKSMFMLGKLLFEEKNDEENGMYWLHKAYENGYADAAGYCGTDLSYEHVPGGLQKISVGAFFKCRSLEGIDLPTGITELGDGAFSGCISLTSIKLPDGVRKLGNGAFAGCINLIGMELSPALAEIAEDSFAGCMRLDRSVLAKLQAINPDVQLTASEKCER